MMNNSKYLIDTNILLYNLINDFVETNLSDENLDKINLYKNLKVEDRIVPFFVVSECFGILHSTLYRKVINYLSDTDKENFKERIVTFFKSFTDSHTVIEINKENIKDLVSFFFNNLELNRKSKTLVDSSLVWLSQNMGYELLTCDRAIINSYKNI